MISQSESKSFQLSNTYSLRETSNKITDHSSLTSMLLLLCTFFGTLMLFWRWMKSMKKTRFFDQIWNGVDSFVNANQEWSIHSILTIDNLMPSHRSLIVHFSFQKKQIIISIDDSSDIKPGSIASYPTRLEIRRSKSFNDSGRKTNWLLHE